MSGRLTYIVGWLRDDLGWMILIEAAVMLAILALAAFRPQTGAQWFDKVERSLQPLLRHPSRQLAVVALLAVGMRGVLIPILAAPEPQIHDEQSLLLQGQTFVSGRMTNPPHTLWPHFESFHINQQPTYSSIYFPGRGIPTALGFFLGHPWIGVWISAVAMSVAVCWMLQAWVPLPWAFVGGVLAVARYGVFSYWINSYWGGAFTAAGGALVMGALPRIIQDGRNGATGNNRAMNGVWLGIGILILMTTRPYEGMLLCAPVALALLVWAMKQPKARFRALIWPVIAPASVFLVIGAAILAYYSWRVTGRATLTPYDANRQMYATTPAFLFLAPYQPPGNRTIRMQRFYDWEFESYSRKQSIGGLVSIAVARVRQVWMFYIGPALTLPFVLSLLVNSGWKIRFLAGSLVFFFAGFLLETWGYPHYASPATASLLGLIVFGLHALRTREWRGRPSGLFLSRAIPVVCLLMLLLPASGSLFGWPAIPSTQGKHWCCTLSEHTPRSLVRDELIQRPGRDLVIVRYTPDYTIHDEWVYNEADIDTADVVWAHDLGPERNSQLLEYFKDREAWVIELGPRMRPRLSPYHANFAR